MKYLLRLVIMALSLLITAYFVPGFAVLSFWTALFAAFILSLVNLFVKPIIQLLTLPLTILTFGLFTLVINALMLLLTAKIVHGFTISGFLPALIGSLVLAIIATLLSHLTGETE